MILGQGGVVWVTPSGQEDSYDLLESCAAPRRHLGCHTSCWYHPTPSGALKVFPGRNLKNGQMSVRIYKYPPEASLHVYKVWSESRLISPLMTRRGRSYPPVHPECPRRLPLPQNHPTVSRSHPGSPNCAGILLRGLEFYFLCGMREQQIARRDLCG